MDSFRCVALRYHTFLAPLPRVRQVTLSALRRMHVQVLPQGAVKKGSTPTIVATAEDWQAEIELQPTSPQTTRMRILAKEGAVLEKNSASEILSWVANSLENGIGWVDRYVEA